MHHVFDDSHVPRAALLGVAAVLTFALAATATARLAGAGFDSRPTAEAVDRRALSFMDRDDGSVAVVDGAGGAPVATIAPGSNGFLRGAMRGLARERLRRGIGPDQPFVLSRFADGRLTLEDPATGRLVDLGSFGPTNTEAFARFLPKERQSP